jgi:dihydrolipoamide dehydrogenase
MARVQRERDRFVGSVLETLEKVPTAHLLRAHGRFVDTRVLALDNGDQVHFDAAVIATGSRPHIPEQLRGAGARLLTSDTVFELPDLPRRLAVFGLGAMGLELGQAFSRLGVHVRIFGSGGLASLKDPVVKEYAAGVFGEELSLDFQAEVISVREVDAGVLIVYRDGHGKRVEKTFDYLLATTGRRPDIENLDLKAAGLSLDEKGMPAWNVFTAQCGDSNLFMAGDVNRDRPLLHEAVDQGRIAGRNAATFPDIRTGLRRAPLSIVFSDPQIASVGMSVEEAKLRWTVVVGEANFEDQGRARIMAANAGILRVYAEADSGIFLGAEMICPHAEHIAHLLSWAAQQRMTIEQMLDMPFYHPVIEEGLRTSLQDLSSQLKIEPQRGSDCMECGPGG